MAETLRPDQEQVVCDALVWVNRARAGRVCRRAHIVLPPRTGKTVIAAHILQRTGLDAVFLVPTRVLVHQTRAELARHAPGLAVGVWYGEVKAPVEHGVNLTTHAALHRGRRSALLARAELVLVDEAHHVLSPRSTSALRELFGPQALFIALTATPEYDTVRSVERMFPVRIARVELAEAFKRDLLAPALMHLAEVDVDGSQVEMVAGDYQPAQLARVLTGAPFLQAALVWRYQEEHRDIPCLIVCVTRAQAEDLTTWLRRHRPAGRPEPALILGETPGDERQRLLQAFDAGEIDTICQVGVLVEGWTSARCKLLIDLAPGRSVVRATQKYFRVLTRDGDAVACMVIIIPRDLPEPPILPVDLLLPPGESYEAGEVIGHRGRLARLPGLLPLQGVRLVQRLVASANLALPLLDASRIDEVRAVLASCAELPGLRLDRRVRFEGLYFRHPLFTGSGRTLLRWLGVPPGNPPFLLWLARVWPDLAGNALLGPTGHAQREEEVEEGVSTDDPLTLLLFREQVAAVLRHVEQIKPRLRSLLLRWTGLEGAGETAMELAEREEVSPSRLQQLLRRAIQSVRSSLYEEERRVPDGLRDDLTCERCAPPHTGDEHPLIARARWLLALGDVQAAVLTARRRLQQRKDDPAAMALIMETRIRQGEDLNLDDLILWMGAPVSATHGAMVRIGWALFDTGRPELAAAVAALPDSGRWETSQLCIQAGDVARALSLAERCSGPNNEDAWHRYLMLYRGGQSYGHALLQALSRDRALRGRVLGPMDPQYHRRAGYLWEATPEAWQEVERVCRLAEVRTWLEVPSLDAFEIEPAWRRAEAAVLRASEEFVIRLPVATGRGPA